MDVCGNDENKDPTEKHSTVEVAATEKTCENEESYEIVRMTKQQH